MQPDLIDARTSIKEECGELFINRSQEIPEYYKDQLRREREEFKWNLNGFTKVATVPVALADKWLSEGFDIYTAPVNEVLLRLRAEEYDLFATAGNRTI